MKNIFRETHVKISKFGNIRNYFLIILILLFETSPFFFDESVTLSFFSIIFVLLLISNIHTNTIILSPNILLLMISIWLLIIFQTFSYGSGFTPALLYKPLWVFYVPYLVFTLMGVKYFKYLFNIIYFVAVYTSIIYLLQTFVPPFNTWLLRQFDNIYKLSWADWPRTILIYSIPRDSTFYFSRNSGIFHEPGAYAIYLMLAIVINLFITNQTFHKKNIFLMSVLLTTFSTAGYLMLILFLGYAIIKSKMQRILKLFVIVFFIALVSYVYNSSGFLEQKLISQYEQESGYIVKEEKNKRGRFYSFGMSLKSFVSAPIFGRGIIVKHRYNVGETTAFGYGFPGLFAKYGLIFAIFYMWYFIKGMILLCKFYKNQKFHAFVGGIVVNLGLLTQGFFFHTPFVYFFIFGLFFQIQRFNKKLLKGCDKIAYSLN